MYLCSLDTILYSVRLNNIPRLFQLGTFGSVLKTHTLCRVRALAISNVDLQMNPFTHIN